jgi:uroporphyrinogen-III synthase
VTSDIGPLTGFTVGITAARRSLEFGAALERRGAAVMYGPAIQIVPVEDDDTLHNITTEFLSNPPDIVVATTGIGFRGWIDAADGWGLGEDLLRCLSAATLLARGPKARGAMRAAGLTGEWSPPSESSTEVLERLLHMDLQGRNVAIQQHGEPLPDLVEALQAAGATVTQVQVYRWQPPADRAPLEKLCRAVADRTIDAVTFTSAPAAASFLQTADEIGIRESVVQAMKGEVRVLAVGPVTAAPLDRAGVPVAQPDRARLGSLVREVAAQLPKSNSRHLNAAGSLLEIRGHGVVINETFTPLPRTSMALLNRLTAHPGQVVSRTDLGYALPGGSPDEHALDTAIGRLRTALRNPRMIQTLVKRGYRIAYDPEFGGTGRY